MASSEPFFNGFHAQVGEMAVLKLFVRIVLGFSLPFLIWYGTGALMENPSSGVWNVIEPEGHGSWGGLWFLTWPIAPFAGYFVMTTAFGPRRDLDRAALVSLVGVSIVYWIVYGRMLLYWVGILLIALGGGI